VLQYLFAVRGRPEHICSRPTLRVRARGPEFVAKALRRWLAQAEVGTLLIATGSPWENGYVESADGKLRDELLNRELCLNLREDRPVIDRWRLDYNHYRIHSALNYQTSAADAAPLCSASFGYASASTTQPSYLTPILSLRLVQRRGGRRGSVSYFLT
jgi:transposase InsO family protein